MIFGSAYFKFMLKSGYDFALSLYYISQFSSLITYNELLTFLMSFENFDINPFEDDLKILQYFSFRRQRSYDDG